MTTQATKYRDNLLKLADYLENEARDTEYDHSTYGFGGELAACALGHAYRSGLFPELLEGGQWALKAADRVFGPGAYSAVFNFYNPIRSRGDAIKAIRAFVAEQYPDEGEGGEVFPPPASVMWERFKAEVTRLFARIFRPLG